MIDNRNTPLMSAQEGGAQMRAECVRDANVLIARASVIEEPDQREVLASIAVKCLMVGSHAPHDPFGSLGVLS